MTTIKLGWDKLRKLEAIVGSGGGSAASIPKTITSTPVTLLSTEVNNAIVFVGTSASVINLPSGAAGLDGYMVTFRAIVAVVYNVKPNDSQQIDNDGTLLTGGNKLTSDGAAGTSLSLVWDNTGGVWRTLGKIGLFTDTGA
jgi:hypothetical protein